MDLQVIQDFYNFGEKIILEFSETATIRSSTATTGWVRMVKITKDSILKDTQMIRLPMLMGTHLEPARR